MSGIANQTYRALVALFPEKEEELTARHEAFQQEISQLDIDLKNQFDQLENKKFLIFHPALSYLARDYGLEQIALEVDGKEPSPNHMKSAVELARTANIRVIFIQKEFDRENARQLANEIGGEVIQIDPLNENWEEQLREIASKITSTQQP